MFVVKFDGFDWRLEDDESNQSFGEYFQAGVRSPEWTSALIVHEKYKRQMSLDYHHLMKLKNHLVSFVEYRKSQGKTTHRDFLTQEASAYVKKNFIPV